MNAVTVLITDEDARAAEREQWDDGNNYLAGGSIVKCLEIGREEKLVGGVEDFGDGDGAGECEAVVVASKGILGAHLFPLLGVEIGIAQKFECISRWGLRISAQYRS